MRSAAGGRPLSERCRRAEPGLHSFAEGPGGRRQAEGERLLAGVARGGRFEGRISNPPRVYLGVTILRHAALTSALRSRGLPSQDTRGEAS